MDEMNLSDAIESILSDPKMKDLMQSLSGSPNQESENKEGQMPDVGKIMKLKSMYDSAMSSNDPRVTLLSALRPYLSDSRVKNLDVCIKFLRFYKIAGMLKDSDILKELLERYDEMVLQRARGRAFKHSVLR